MPDPPLHLRRWLGDIKTRRFGTTGQAADPPQPTPAAMRAHSWHPVLLLVWGRNVLVDE